MPEWRRSPHGQTTRATLPKAHVYPVNPRDITICLPLIPSPCAGSGRDPRGCGNHACSWSHARGLGHGIGPLRAICGHPLCPITNSLVALLSAARACFTHGRVGEGEGGTRTCEVLLRLSHCPPPPPLPVSPFRLQPRKRPVTCNDLELSIFQSLVAVVAFLADRSRIGGEEMQTFAELNIAHLFSGDGRTHGVSLSAPFRPRRQDLTYLKSISRTPDIATATKTAFTRRSPALSRHNSGHVVSACVCGCWATACNSILYTRLPPSPHPITLPGALAQVQPGARAASRNECRGTGRRHQVAHQDCPCRRPPPRACAGAPRQGSRSRHARASSRSEAPSSTFLLPSSPSPPLRRQRAPTRRRRCRRG